MDKARVQAYLQAACAVLNFDIGEIWCCRYNIPEPPPTAPKTTTSKDLRYIQLYTSPHYERHRDKLVIPRDIPDETDVDKHNFSPLICEAVREARQVVWAHTRQHDGLLGRTDLPLRTAVGVPICSIGFDLCILLMYSPDVVELTDDAHRFLFTVAQAASDAVCGFLPASSSSPVQSPVALARGNTAGDAAGPHTRVLINALPPTVTIQMVDMASVPNNPVKAEFMETFDEAYYHSGPSSTTNSSSTSSTMPPLMPPVPPLMPEGNSTATSGGDPTDSLPPLEDCILPDLLEDSDKGGMEVEDWDFEAALDFIFDSSRANGPVDESEWINTQQRAAFDEAEQNSEMDSPITYFYKDRLQRVRFEEFVKGFLSMSVFHTAECWVAREEQTIEPVFCATCLGDVEKWKEKSSKLYADPTKALPTRVSRENRAIWEQDFDRLNGAAPPRTNAEKAYSVYTAFGLPVQIDRKHRLIVIFYSTFSLDTAVPMEDFIKRAMDLLWKCTMTAFASFLDIPSYAPELQAPNLVSADYTESPRPSSPSRPHGGDHSSTSYGGAQHDPYHHVEHAHPPPHQHAVKQPPSVTTSLYHGSEEASRGPPAGAMQHQHHHHHPTQQTYPSYPNGGGSSSNNSHQYPAPSMSGSSYGGGVYDAVQSGQPHSTSSSSMHPSYNEGPAAPPYLKPMHSSSSTGGGSMYAEEPPRQPEPGGSAHLYPPQQQGGIGVSAPGGMPPPTSMMSYHPLPHSSSSSSSSHQQQPMHGYPSLQQQHSSGGPPYTSSSYVEMPHVNGGMDSSYGYGQQQQQQPQGGASGINHHTMGQQMDMTPGQAPMGNGHMGPPSSSYGMPASAARSMMPIVTQSHQQHPHVLVPGGVPHVNNTMSHQAAAGAGQGYIGGSVQTMRMIKEDYGAMSVSAPQEYTISSEILDLDGSMMHGKVCKTDLCGQPTAKRSPYCMSHTGARHCQAPGCTKCAQGNTKFCIAHGGGRRCTYPGCTKGARDKNFCAAHGGGKRCTMDGCTKSAVGGSNLCTAHGGGRRCHFQDCTRSAQSSTNFCVRHGGGRKCQVEGCQKVARGRTSYCAAHGGGVRCKVEGCNKAAVGKFQMCRMHSGYPKKRASESISSTHFLGDFMDTPATKRVAMGGMATGMDGQQQHQYHDQGGGGGTGGGGVNV